MDKVSRNNFAATETKPTRKESNMSPCLGLDVAKAKVDAALLMENGKFKTKVFCNSAKGFAQLQAWLAACGAERVHACMEATGAYHEALSTYLFDQGHSVSVINPQRIKSFGASEGIRTKNDQIDARLIARFCKRMQPQVWQPEPLEIRELRALGRRRDDLVAMRAQESNRAGLNTALVEKSIARSLASLDQWIEEIDREIKDHINRHPGLKTRFDLLRSIPGIGSVCAEAILSESGGFFRFERVAEAVAFVCLSPLERSSGTSVRGKSRISKKGNNRLRHLLYMPAMSAKRHNPLVAALAQRLTAKGKAKKAILCACMRKLLHIAYGVLKHNQPFNPNFSPASS